MTEREWLEATDLECLMDYMSGRVSERKLMLFGCACCYRRWSIIPNGYCKLAVETSERFADGCCDATELRRARERVKQENPNLFWYQVYECHAEAASYYAAFDRITAQEMEAEHPLDQPGDYLAILKCHEVAAQMAVAHSRAEEEWKREVAALCDLLRDIVGNPFRQVAVNRAWQTSTVVSLAQAVYNDRAFECFPILADALEEAGCSNAEILDHCRGPGPHVKGCWVIDALTGRV